MTRLASRTLAIACLLVAILPCSPLRADNPPLTNDQYRIDLHFGPVLGNTRVVGLGGAYTAVAEGAVGIPYSPTSVANRPWHSRDPFDIDVATDCLIPGFVQGEHFDFDNNDRPLPTDMTIVNLGGQVQIEDFGFGAYAQAVRYDFEDGETPAAKFRADIGIIRIPFAVAVFDHALLIGCGPRIGFLDLAGHVGGGDVSMSATRVGMEYGLMFRPTFMPVRLSLSFHSPLHTDSSTHRDAGVPASFYLPEKGVAVPWDLSVGLSVFLSGRRFNAVPDFESKETGPRKPERWFEKMSVMLSLGLLITGNTGHAIGIDGFLRQVEERSGRQNSISPRAGLEAEVWPGRLRIRHGLYWEPSRIEGFEGRLHFTFAADLRLFDFELFGDHSLMVSFATDFARRYSNMSFSVGFWF